MRRLSLLLLVFLALVPACSAAAAPASAAAAWDALSQPAFDSNEVAAVERVELQHDAATLTLTSGQLALGQPVATPSGTARVCFAAFKGTGRLLLAPSLPMEQQQLSFFSGQTALDVEFTRAVFVFTDDTARQLGAQVNFGPGDPSDLADLYRDRHDDWRSVGLSWDPKLLRTLLSDNPFSHTLFVAEVDTDKFDWLTLIDDADDPEQMELEHFDSGRRSLDIWTKFPAGGRTPQAVFEHPEANEEYLLSAYTLNVTVQDNTELQGDADVSVDLHRAGERVLLLSLDPNLQVDSVTAEGQSLSFLQPPDPEDHFFLADYLAVISPQPFPEGTTTLHFHYAGKRVIRRMGNGNFFCQSFGWYPSYGSGRYSITTNEFASRSDFDLTLRVPKKYEAVAVGQKVEEKEDGDFQFTHWKSEIPLAVAGFAYGDYKVEKEKVGDVEVEVYANKNPDDFMRSIEIATSNSLPTNGVQAMPQFSLGSLSPARLRKTMATEVSNALKVFEKFYGPYPYKKLAVSNISYSYGQGWPSLLYVSALTFLDSTQRQQLGLTGHTWLTDFFRAHETSHQWWGHEVGWKSYHDQWLSEGFAEFSGILYALFRENVDEYYKLLRQEKEDLLQSDREGAVYEQIGPIYAGLRLSSGKHPGGYSNVVYKKGGWVLHMLRMMLYNPRDPKNPDAAFMDMMKDFTHTYFNRAASTEDFKHIVEKHMLPAMDIDRNGTMDWFFNAYVYGIGIPHYRLRYTIEPAEQGQFILSGTLYQSNVPPGFEMAVPVYLHKGKNFGRAGWIGVHGPETPFKVKLGFKPDKVSINDMDDILCTVD